MKTNDTLGKLASQLRCLGISATVEHPGYISVPLSGDRELALGFANGPLGWDVSKDGITLDGGETGFWSRTPIGSLVSEAESIIRHLEG